MSFTARLAPQEPAISDIGFGCPFASTSSVNTTATPQTVPYRVKAPLRALTGERPVGVIPVGSTIEWTQADSTGGIARVTWLRQKVLIREADIFTKCVRAELP